VASVRIDPDGESIPEQFGDRRVVAIGLHIADFDPDLAIAFDDGDIQPGRGIQIVDEIFHVIPF